MLALIDRAAAWWLNKRIDAQAEAASQATGVKFHKASMDASGFNVTLIAPDLLLLIEQAAGLLNQQNAENYVQFDMIPRLSRQPYPRPVRVTVQWMNGLSPAEKNARLERECDDWQRQAADCQASLNRLALAAEELRAANDSGDIDRCDKALDALFAILDSEAE